ncbi:MAG: hypothetical protein RR640_03405, partial [Oscillospiraceae bacterium]
IKPKTIIPDNVNYNNEIKEIKTEKTIKNQVKKNNIENYNLTDTAKKVYNELFEKNESQNILDLIENTSLLSREIMSAVTELELEGLIIQSSGRNFKIT